MKSGPSKKKAKVKKYKGTVVLIEPDNHRKIREFAQPRGLKIYHLINTILREWLEQTAARGADAGGG